MNTPFINIVRNIEPRQLDELILLGSRIAYALERLAGPEPVTPSSERYKAQLSDLHNTARQPRREVKEELETFADNMNVVLDSDAFLKSIIQYEEQVASVYGENSLLELPWNQKAGRLIFRHRHQDAQAGRQDGSQDARQQMGETAADPLASSRGTDAESTPRAAPQAESE